MSSIKFLQSKLTEPRSIEINRWMIATHFLNIKNVSLYKKCWEKQAHKPPLPCSWTSQCSIINQRYFTPHDAVSFYKLHIFFLSKKVNLFGVHCLSSRLMYCDCPNKPGRHCTFRNTCNHTADSCEISQSGIKKQPYDHVTATEHLCYYRDSLVLWIPTMTLSFLATQTYERRNS
jgi:hypothetical protein